MSCGVFWVGWVDDGVGWYVGVILLSQLLFNCVVFGLERRGGRIVDRFVGVVAHFSGFGYWKCVC